MIIRKCGNIKINFHQGGSIGQVMKEFKKSHIVKILAEISPSKKKSPIFRHQKNSPPK
jgi:DNA-binding TFAR19-related protein (PDSD5 family)